MKVKFSALLAGLCTFSFILSSCGKTDCAPVDIDSNISCHADISQDGTVYSAELERADGAGWKAVFTAPETIEGMEISLFNDSCTIKFKDLNYTASREELPQFGMVDLVTSALDECAKKTKLKCTQSGDKVTQQGKVKGLDFKAQFKNKKLSSLEISDELTVNFS